MPLPKRRKVIPKPSAECGPEQARVLLLFSLAKKVAKKAIAQSARSLAPHSAGLAWTRPGEWHFLCIAQRKCQKERGRALFGLLPALYTISSMIVAVAQTPRQASVETRRSRYASFGSDRRPVGVRLTADGI